MCALPWQDFCVFIDVFLRITYNITVPDSIERTRLVYLLHLLAVIIITPSTHNTGVKTSRCALTNCKSILSS